MPPIPANWDRETITTLEDLGYRVRDRQEVLEAAVKAFRISEHDALILLSGSAGDLRELEPPAS